MRIAVVGSGISGLVSAYLLSRKYEVTLFEANDYLGGHTNTATIELDGQTHRVDTGFIVFNDKTYPLFNKLLKEIGQAFQDSEMSFSVCNMQTGLEYNGHNLNSLFAQRRNILSPRFYSLLGEIVRFNRRAKTLYRQPDGQLTTLSQFLDQEQYSQLFVSHYLLPMVAAIWSCSLQDALAFPLRFFLQFFYHHGLLNVAERPQWHVLKNGSSSYLPALTAPYRDRIHLQTPVTGINRDDNGVTLRSSRGDERYDAVVLACHSDQSLAMLDDASHNEEAVLSAMRYQANEVVLHQDASVMPARRRAWASWNFLYHDLEQQRTAPALVSYYMNRLQGLTNAPDLFVTLNGTERIDQAKILRQYSYDHPMMDAAMIQAQQQRGLINGVDRTYYCGAYWYNGFHEDGVRSAVDVCQQLGIDW